MKKTYIFAGGVVLTALLAVGSRFLEPEVFWSILGTVAFFALLIWLFTISQRRDPKKPRWITSENVYIPILYALAITLAHLVLSALVPRPWGYWWGSTWAFVITNLTLWIAFSMRVIKEEVADPKKASTQPTIRRISNGLIAIVVIGTAILIIYGYQRGRIDGSDFDATLRAEELIDDEPVLKLIADCASGDGTRGSHKHYEKDGVIVENTATGEVGMFMISLKKHGDDANRFFRSLENTKFYKEQKAKITLRDPEGNVRYAKYLHKREGIAAWSDKMNPCIARQITLSMVPTLLARATAPVGIWSERVYNIDLDPRYFAINFRLIQGDEDEPCSVRIDGDDTQVFDDCTMDTVEFKRAAKYFQFQTTGSRPLTVVANIVRKKR